MAQKHRSEFEIGWTTITYRSVVIFVLSVIAIAGVVMYLAFPDQARSSARSLGGYFNRVLESFGIASERGGKRSGAGQQQAQFTQLDGTVRVKKTNSNKWVTADYTLPLERGDVVQTGSEGMAKIVFVDGTNYTIKEDSLIVIEENSKNAEAQTQVGIQVTTGTVDLATATYVQGSRSQVIVAGAKASIAPESSAMVRNDPRAERSEILVKTGSGEVQRGQTIVTLGDYEKLSFSHGSERMVKTKEMRPPTLIAPANMMPIFGSNPVTFSWTPTEHSRAYRLRISRNPYFSSTVLDKKVYDSDLRVPGLKEGAYYWMVQAIDAAGRYSLESEKNRFTVIPRSSESLALALELQPFIQHGHVIEVRGKTEPTARVMVNGNEVPVIAGDGKFSYFTPPLPRGENVITVTAQNARGGVNTQQKRILIQ